MKGEGLTPCPRNDGPLTSTATTAIRQREPLPFTKGLICHLDNQDVDLCNSLLLYIKPSFP